MIIVVNTHTAAVGHYEQYPFNSYCEIDGMYFGAGQGGLYQLDVGNTDDGVQIDAGLQTGYMNFKDTRQKRVENAYLTIRNEGELLLTTTIDDGARSPTSTMTIPNYAVPELTSRRVIIPKGLRGEAWQFELTNTAGAMFDFGHLGLLLAPSSRHI